MCTGRASSSSWFGRGPLPPISGRVLADEAGGDLDVPNVAELPQFLRGSRIPKEDLIHVDGIELTSAELVNRFPDMRDQAGQLHLVIGRDVLPGLSPFRLAGHSRKATRGLARRGVARKIHGWLSSMRVFSVDERDSSWELPAPRFRVYLHGSERDATCGWTATYDILDADVLQAIDWAQRQAGDQLTYAVALVYDDAAHERLDPGHGRGLVWLLGRDGNDSPNGEPALAEAQQRMLKRRHDPVRVPEADRPPADLEVGDPPTP